MLGNFFGKSSPINFILITGIYLVYFFAHYFVNYPTVSLSELVILIPLTILVFFFYNFILFKNKLTLYNSYGFLIFVILFGIFSISGFDRNTILFNGLLLIFLRRVFSLRSANNNFGKLFDTGFWLGIFFLFEPFSAVLGFLIYVSNGLFQNLNWRSIFIPVAGFFVPVFCAFAYYFWLDLSIVFWNNFNWYTNYDFTVYKAPSFYIPITIISSLTVLAYFFKTPKVVGISGNYRKYWIVISVLLLTISLFIVLLNQRNGAELQYLFFPISVILANWVESIRSKIIKEVVLIIVIVSPLLVLIT